jgi:hypothetical protein
MSNPTMKPSEKRIGVVPVLGIAAASPPPVYYAEPVQPPTAIGRAAGRCGTAIEEFGSDHAFKYATETAIFCRLQFFRLRLGPERDERKAGDEEDNEDDLLHCANVPLG